MTRTEIRRANLQRLARQAGGITAVARRVGTSENYLTQIAGGYTHGSGNPRAISDKMADRLEDAHALPRGWMDIPEGAIDEATMLADHERELLALLRGADDRLRRGVVALVKAYLGENTPI